MLFFSFSQGTIYLPGNKVSEHPSSGEDGGKFLFEVIPGRKTQKLYISVKKPNTLMLTGAKHIR